MVVVLYTELGVCGLASHTTLSDFPVTHPSFLSPFQMKLTNMSMNNCYRISAFEYFIFQTIVFLILLSYLRVLLYFWIYGYLLEL